MGGGVMTEQFNLASLDYEGLIIVSDEDDDSALLFAPLDWASEDTGSAAIEYRNSSGQWEVL